MGKLAVSYFILLKWVSILRNVDDTIIFMEHDLEKAVNMNLILYIFEQLSGLKVNFHKRKILCFGQAKEVEDEYKHISECEARSFLLNILAFLFIIRDCSIKKGNQ
jgi:hypothetical protein